MSVHLILDDEDWRGMLEAIEEPLLLQITGAPREPGEDDWRLPAVFAGREVVEAHWRIAKAVRSGLENAQRHRLLAADGRHEFAPLVAVELATADVDLLATVARECNRALAGLGDDDLWELLGEVADPGGRDVQVLVAELVKVLGPLRLPSDADTEALIEVIGTDTGARDQVLTVQQEQAYGRFARRWVRAMDGDSLQLFAFGVTK